MSGTNAWSRGREKIRLFPELFAQCAGEVSVSPNLILTFGFAFIIIATAYGKCVAGTTTGRQELKKDVCAKEFEALKTCFTNAAKKRAK
ncbi:hypothetical protein F2P81_022134 [Scophthalmus maximus]|uniref:Uncharacterized protein n=1 Tax=Scophthalmus maximus TaxID=52904 RepID=A0A6A4RTA9_SCOMX|nr:hypothetical protein F2P81_022134 [Scophthalmus maximus]